MHLPVFLHEICTSIPIHFKNPHLCNDFEALKRRIDMVSDYTDDHLNKYTLCGYVAGVMSNSLYKDALFNRSVVPLVWLG